MSKTKMLAAQELIREKRYDEARAILRAVDHPKAVEWLEKLDKIDPPSALQKIFRAVLPKTPTVQANPIVKPPPPAEPAMPVQVPAEPPISSLPFEEDEPEETQAATVSVHSKRHSRFLNPVAGEFDGIQFRSQLEIRFAAELKKRGIRYEYEPQRMGKGSYLIDFHLPDHGIWVEVKGKMDARDEYLLQECADYLQESRSHSLYVYSSDRKMHLVHHDHVEYLWPGKFWDMLEEKQSHK